MNKQRLFIHCPNTPWELRWSDRKSLGQDLTAKGQQVQVLSDPVLSSPRVQASDHHTCCCEHRTASWALSPSFPRPESFVSPPFSLEQLTTLRGSILEDATPTAMKHGTGRGLPLRDALEYVIPELNIHCLRLALNTPKVTEQLLKLDEQGVSRGPGWVGTQGQQPAAPLPNSLPSHFFFSSKEQKPTQASSS